MGYSPQPSFLILPSGMVVSQNMAPLRLAPLKSASSKIIIDIRALTRLAPLKLAYSLGLTVDEVRQVSQENPD